MRRVLMASVSAHAVELVGGIAPLPPYWSLYFEPEMELISFDGDVPESDDFIALMRSTFHFPGENIDYACDENERSDRPISAGEFRSGDAVWWSGTYPKPPAPPAQDYDAYPSYARLSLADARELGQHLARIEEEDVRRASFMLAAASAAATGAAEEESRRYRDSPDGDVFERMFGERPYIMVVAFDSDEDRIVSRARDLFGEIDLELIDRVLMPVVLERPEPRHWNLQDVARGPIPGPKVRIHRNPVWRRA